MPTTITQSHLDAATRKADRKRQIGFAVCVVIAALTYLALLGPGGLMTGAGFSLLALFGIGRAFIVSRRLRSGKLYWRGTVGFQEDDVDDPATFPDLVRKKKPNLGRRGISGGTLEITGDGLGWRAGSVATPRCEISGSFKLSWDTIESIDVGDIPGKVNALGASLLIKVRGKHNKVHGELLGSRRALVAALDKATGSTVPNSQ